MAVQELEGPLLGRSRFGREFEDIDVVEVVEVLPIEPSEDHHAATHEAGAVSSPGFGVVPRVAPNSEPLHCVVCHIDHQHIVQVTAEPSSKHVYFSIKYDRRVAPPAQERGSLQLPLNPLQLVSLPSLQEGSQVEGKDVTQAPVLSVASSDHKELVPNHTRRVESPGAGPAAVFINFDFGPSLGLEIECPEVLHVCEALPSEDHQVGVT